MWLEWRVLEDPPDGSVAYLGDALAANVFAQQRCRPVRYRDADIFRRSARLGLDPCRVRVREREIGRPERGASANFSATLSTPLKRFFHLNTVRT